MAQVTVITVLAMALATSYDTAHAQGFFTDSTCSCTMSDAGVSSKCITPIPGLAGTCREGPCKAGFKCDMAGTSMCRRSMCSTYIATTTQNTNPDGVNGFDCVQSDKKTDCVTEDPSLLLQATPNPTPGCVYNKGECACSESKGQDLCVKFDSVLGGKPQCKLDACTSGYKCDCLSPTHICKRSTCSFYIASKLHEDEAFPCSPSSADCAKVDRPLKP